MAIKKQQKRSLKESQSGPVETEDANKQSQKFKKIKTEKPVQKLVQSNGVEGKKIVKMEKQKRMVEEPKNEKNQMSPTTLEAKNAAKRLKNAEMLKKKNDNRKEARKEQGQYKAEKVMLSPEEIQLRIENIQNRPELTKTAKRRLAVLRKKLHIVQGTYVPKSTPVNDGPKLSKSKKRMLRKKNNAERRQAQGKTTDSEISVKTENVEKTNKKGPTAVKIETKKQEQVIKVAGKKPQHIKVKEAKKLVVKKEELENSEDEDNEEEEKEEEEEEDTDEDTEDSNGSVLNTTEDDEDEVEDEDDDEDEDDEEEEDEEEEEEEEDEQEEEKEVEVPVKNAKLDRKKQQPLKKEIKDEPVQNDNAGKKKRFVLFIGNLSYNASPEEIKKHFLTKVSEVSSVRVPSKPGSNTPRGFAYVEFENHTDYEKGLSLHNTILNGRRINVQYTQGGSKSVGNKHEVVSKNKKLHAMRKQGMLAGSQKNGHKRNDRRQKQRQQGPA